MVSNQATDKIDKLAAQFQFTIEMSPEAVFWLERSGQFSYVNAQACRSLGYTNEELLSLFLWDIDPDFPKEHWDVHWGNLTTVGTRTFETRHRRKDGLIFPVEVCACQIVFDGNEFHSAFVRDITEHKQTMEKLVEYRDKLQFLVNEQTQELKAAHAALLQRERLATLGRLTATVNHELRNPLGTIQTSLFSIKDKLERNVPHQVARSFELAERNIHRCVKIIDELNSFTRVKELTISEVSFGDWLKTVIKEQSIPKEIVCELNVSNGFQASFDEEKLRQVVVNLTTNAVHALQDKESEKKHLMITVLLLDEEYELRFSDNGIGMSDDVKEKVFEPLYSTKGFGVGLGMVIVKNIVEQHHGEISIESKRGAGTTVILRLPINLQDERKVS